MATKYKNIKDFYNRINLQRCINTYSFDVSLSRTSVLPSSFRYHFNLKKSRRITYNNGSRSILHNRCVYSGNARSVSRFFRLSRMVFKYLAVNGLLTGVSKYSW